jgi:TldD protein
LLDLLEDLIGAVPSGCAYADARWVSQRTEHVGVRSGYVEDVETDAQQGIGVRVAHDGGWGFAATRELSAAGARDALARALAIASAQPTTAARPLAPVPPARGEWSGPCGRDPLAVSLDDKVDLLLEAEALLRDDPRIVRSSAECLAIVTEKAFASTDGGAYRQSQVQCGGGISAYALAGDELQVRSYPSSHGGNVAAAGWEHLLALDLAGNAPRVRDEALALLSAPPCPAGRATLVLGDEQLALQLHESVGHALELDRILLGELSYAGSSWVTADDLGTLRYGSEAMNVTADATLPGALGSFAWDDEGVAAQRTPLIEQGIVRAALADRQSAAAIGLAGSNGCARADGFARQPIVRMTNVSIEPGAAGTLDELIADTDEGIYMETNRSWSIDDRRLQFQFATEVAREIRAGELGRLYRNPSYAGITPRFWSSLDAVCSAPAWRLWGLLNCGKGEPGQIMHVSHGAAPARFRDVEVGVA